MINEHYAQARARGGGVSSKTLHRIKHLAHFCSQVRARRRQGFVKGRARI
jgi:hypothetical protein